MFRVIILSLMLLGVGRSFAADDLVLNYHLMHAGTFNAVGDPNAAFFWKGQYHLHYYMSEGYAHVSSPDMLHWKWHETSLSRNFTGNNICSGTGFYTKEGRPAVIFHLGTFTTGRIHTSVSADDLLDRWETPVPVIPRDANGNEVNIHDWDPDCFLIGDTYYAYNGGWDPKIMKSTDLENWTFVGDLFDVEPDDVMFGEDLSCGNFFPIGDKWMLLCISHVLGCRYYIGEWDAPAEKFVPELAGRMNWERGDVPDNKGIWPDFFAPESFLTPDGRRVMWAWIVPGDVDFDKPSKILPGGTPLYYSAIYRRSVQCLPRELSLPEDGVLRIRPLQELETLRRNEQKELDITINTPKKTHGICGYQQIAELPGEACELEIIIPRSQAARKKIGFLLFADDEMDGFPIVIKPNAGTIKVGGVEAPFAVADLPEGEDLDLRIFIDKYLVEVFVNNRQAVVGAYMDYQDKLTLHAYSYQNTTKISELTTWSLEPTNQGLLDAWESQIWKTE